jgi:DNA-binding MarR family transcriptional regulator
MSDTWDAAGYIASSRYRLAVCEFLLRDGPELPSKIAAELELAQPHVSRALSELRERDVVELLVPESQQKGRLYDLTPEGRTSLVRLQGEAAAVNVEFVEATAFPYGELLEYLRDSYESSLRLAIARNGDLTKVYRASKEMAETYDKQSVSRIVAALSSGETDDESMDRLPTGRTRFLLRGFERAMLLRLPVSDEREVYISFDRGTDIPVDSFVSECQTQLSMKN